MFVIAQKKKEKIDIYNYNKIGTPEYNFVSL